MTRKGWRAVPREQKKRSLSDDFQTWMQQQQRDPAQLTYDNRPEGFFHAFPKKDDLRVTRQALETRLWWWRYAKAEECTRIFLRQEFPGWPDVMWSLFREHYQLSAL